MSAKLNGIFYTTESGASPVEDWLDAQNERVQIRIDQKMRLLEEFPTNRNFTKPIRDGIFEIIEDCDKKWMRVLFFYFDRDSIVYLHAFQKKTNKTPPRDIKIALTRKKDFTDRYTRSK